MEKRKEILFELIYYVFDSFLIPLIRSNFYVTESSQHRNRLFYFRHDVWRVLTEPSINHMKSSMLSELKLVHAKRIPDTCQLGFSQFRLLPKGPGVRPIMNLRRRTARLQNGKVFLGKSINSELGPVQSMLNYEKGQQPSRLGSSLLSIGDLYGKLKNYCDRVFLGGSPPQHLFFAKVDVQSCFDTIPQEKLIRLMRHLVSEDEYSLANYVELIAPDTKGFPLQPRTIRKVGKRFLKKMTPASHQEDAFEEIAAQNPAKCRGAVVVDKGAPVRFNSEKLLDLLEQHVRNNTIKIGKKHYRQKKGIPQGSVLSSLLCSFFYAEFESQRLGFLQSSESLLLRLIDDFLLITIDRRHASRFLQVMHDGNEEFGIKVNPAKSLVNFEAVVNGYKLQQAPSIQFPYCGLLIHTRALELSRDRERRKCVGESRHFRRNQCAREAYYE